MILNSYPSIDVHGETTETVVCVINEFVNDNYKMKYKHIVIVHGIGTGVLRKKVHELLKQNKLVENYKLGDMNLGATLVTLKTNK